MTRTHFLNLIIGRDIGLVGIVLFYISLISNSTFAADQKPIFVSQEF